MNTERPEVKIPVWPRWTSVDVPHVPLLRRELLHIRRRLRLAQAAVQDGDVPQRLVDVPGHAGGVPADVEAGALPEPVPQLGAVLAHPVLDVDLGALVTGEGGV